MKPYYLTAMVEDQIINKILVDGVVAFNILPKSMSQRFDKSLEDLIPNNIMVYDFCGKPSDSKGVICLDISVGNKRRPTMFLVVSSQATFNMLLGREWIHGIGAVPSTVH